MAKNCDGQPLRPRQKIAIERDTSPSMEEVRMLKVKNIKK